MNEPDKPNHDPPQQRRRLPKNQRRYSDEFLRRLRNEIPIRSVIQALSIPHKYRDGYFRFLCPVCEFTHTAINPQANLARCFRCKRNFNPLELVMAAESADFVLAVSYLTPMLPGDQQG